jgi:glycerol-3-phosphate acyltransferase PlsY
MSLHLIPLLIALPPASYLLGSIPFGLLITRALTGADLRKTGSGNIGATNARRIAGNVAGAMTLGADVLKAAVPTAVALWLTGAEGTAGRGFVSLVALAAFFGHLFPLYLRFRSGGKGVATAAGGFLVLSPPAVGVALLVFVLGVCWGRRVSLGSLAAAAALPPACWKAEHSVVITLAALLAAGAIFLRHRDNVKRLLDGTEPRV